MLLNVKIDSLIMNSPKQPSELLKEINFNVSAGCIYTILGKNGSGKSTLAKAVGGLLDKKQYKIKGEILFENENILNLSEEDLITIRKNKIRYVLQDSINSFDPLKKLHYYFKLTKSQPDEINGLLEYFRLPASNAIIELYPFQASAGMLQRISLVLALLARPSLLVLDEPTSSIDTPIINLFLLKLKEYGIQNKTGILLITQDIILAHKISNKIAVLENGTLRSQH